MEEADLALGDFLLLEEVVGLVGQGHVGGVGADQDGAVLFEDEVDAEGPLGELFGVGEGGQALGGAEGVEVFGEGAALGGVDAGEGDEGPGVGEAGGDAGAQTAGVVTGEEVVADDLRGFGCGKALQRAAPLGRDQGSKGFR